MSDHQFIRSYFEDFSDLLKPNKELIEKLIQIRDLLLEVNKNNKKILIFGNGGSASIASHFSVDLTKNEYLLIIFINL
jgi:phosphoheptose isomerase